MKKELEKQQTFAAKLSIAGWIVIILISLTAGLITDSITLLLDSAQGLVTLVIAFLVHLTIQKLGKPPDDDYHFGYDKYEPLTSALQEIMIMVTCFICIKFAVQDLIHAEPLSHYNTALAAALLAGLISLGIAFWVRQLAHASHSEVLKQSITLWLLDSALSFGIFGGFLLGLLLDKTGYSYLMPYTDPIMAIILALIFILVPLTPLKSALLELLDAAPEQRIRQDIRKIVEQHKPNEISISQVRMRKAGKKIFLEISFSIDESLAVKQALQIVADFEKLLAEKIPGCDIVLRYHSAQYMSLNQ